MTRRQGRLFDVDDAPRAFGQRRAPSAPLSPRPAPTPDGWRPDPIPELHGETTVILNAETTGLRWWDGDRPIGWAYWLPASGRHGYLPIRHAAGNLPVEQVHAWLRSLRGLRVENVNTKFDLHMAREDGVDLVEDTGNTFGDVAHRAALLDDHRLRFNLDQLSLDELGWNVETDGLGKLPAGIPDEGGFKTLPSWVVAPYAVRNAEQVARLLDAYQPRLDAEDLNEVDALERDIIPVVVEMERNGTYLDLPLLDEWLRRCKRELDEKLWNVYQATGVDIESPDSPKDLARVFAARNIPITSWTATGAPSFTDAVMKAAAERDPVIADLRAAGQLADLDSKYLSKYAAAVRADGWLRFNLHQLRSGKGPDDKKGTVSGRFSAAGDRFGGYNPQQVVAVEKQLERGWCPDYVIRKLFIPKTQRMLAADMMQVEYRLFAHYANDPNILAVYRDNPLADYHKVVMELLHRINPTLNRKLVKNTNFAKIYGAGLIKFALMIGAINEVQYSELSERLSVKDWSALSDPALADARNLNDAYNAMFPAVKPLLELASSTAQERGYVKTIKGRRARLTGRFHSALNRIVQGGAADINKIVLAEVYRQRKALGLTLRLTVHDEVVADLADGADERAVDRVLNRQYVDLRVPILWDLKTGPNWAACK